MTTPQIGSLFRAERRPSPAVDWPSTSSGPSRSSSRASSAPRLVRLRYRAGRKGGQHDTDGRESIRLEVIYTVVPSLLVVVLFFGVARLLHPLSCRRGLRRYVIGKQWMWKLQHPNGARHQRAARAEGRTVKLTMSSQDVIHGFSSPRSATTRRRPGRYTTMVRGQQGREYHVFCAEYCGRALGMVGIVVMEPDDYKEWLAEVRTGRARPGRAELFRQTPASPATARRVRADCSNGAREAVTPSAERPSPSTRTTSASRSEPDGQGREGLPAVMPTYKGTLTEKEVTHLIAYIKAQGTRGGEAA